MVTNDMDLHGRAGKQERGTFKFEDGGSLGCVAMTTRNRRSHVHDNRDMVGVGSGTQGFVGMIEGEAARNQA